jgi:hypothetical protein
MIPMIAPLTSKRETRSLPHLAKGNFVVRWRNGDHNVNAC